KKRKARITAVTRLVPLGKFNINLVLCIDPSVDSGPIGEESEHRCLIHVVDIALDNPLVRPKSHSVGRKQLRGSPFPLALGDLEMKITAGVDIDIGRVPKRNPS